MVWFGSIVFALMLAVPAHLLPTMPSSFHLSPSSNQKQINLQDASPIQPSDPQEVKHRQKRFFADIGQTGFLKPTFHGIRVQWFPTPIAPQFFSPHKIEVHMPAFLYNLFQKWLYPEL